MLLGICALTLCHASVTWTGPADRLGRLLPEIGAKIGRPWKASPAIAGEVLFVHVKDVDPDELQKRIATCLDASWEEAEGTLYLTRRADNGGPDNLPNAAGLAQVAVKEATKQLQTKLDLKAALQSLDEVERAYRATEPFSDVRGLALTKFESVMAGRRLIYRIILALGEKNIERALQKPRTVFAPKPNRAQEAMPAGYRQLLDESVRENEAWSQAVAGREEEVISLIHTTPVDSVDPELVNTMHLVATNNGAGSQASFTLHGHHPYINGMVGEETIGQFSVGLTDIDSALESVAAGRSPEIELSELSRKVVTLLASRTVVRPSVLGDADVRDQLLGPAETDPLGGWVSECLEQWASSRPDNTVAAIPDSAWYWFVLLFRTGVAKVDGVQTILADHRTGTDLHEGGGWTIVKPSRKGWNHWLERTTGQDILRKFAKEGELGLDDRCTAAFANRVLHSDWLRYCLGALTNDDVDRLLDVNAGYVLWGSLNKAQRTTLRSEGRLSVSSLTSEQRRVVDGIVFSDALYWTTPNEERWSVHIVGEPVDPTEACPDGLPSGAYLTFQTFEFPRVFAFGGTPENPSVLRVLDRRSARQVASSNPEDRGRWMGNWQSVIGYGVAREILSNLTIVVGPKWGRSFELIEKEGRPKGKPVPWDQLPDDVKTPPSKLD